MLMTRSITLTLRDEDWLVSPLTFPKPGDTRGIYAAEYDLSWIPGEFAHAVFIDRHSETRHDACTSQTERAAYRTGQRHKKLSADKISITGKR
jgi:hypothetical protein